MFNPPYTYAHTYASIDATMSVPLLTTLCHRDRRATVLEKERIAEEEEEAERQRQERLKQRKLESHQLLAEQLKKEVMGEGKMVQCRRMDGVVE